MPLAYLPLIVVGLAVLLVVLVITVISRAVSRRRERKALETMHPNEPWLWRRDWANSAVEDRAQVSAGFLWFFGIMWLLITTPVSLLFLKRVHDDPFMGLVTLFPIAGVLVLSGATYLSLRRRKYGVSICHLDRLPPAIGETLRGSIEARLTEMPADGFQLKLTNVRITVTGSGKNRSVHERVLWQDEQVIRTGAMPNPYGLRLPFAIRIPAQEVEAADERNPDSRVVWRLEVAAEVPGIDYKAQFELPVFATSNAVDAWTPDVDPRGWTPPPDSGVALGIAANGEEIVTRPTQRVWDWIPTVLFFVLWFGVLTFMVTRDVPLFVAAVFGLISLVIIVMLGDLFVGRSRVVLANGYVVARRTWLGIGGKARTVQRADVESITPQVGLTAGARVYHDVVIKLKSGGRVRALKHIPRRRDAEMLAAKLRRAIESA